MTPAMRRLYAPVREAVEVDSAAVPDGVGGVPVRAVREQWRVEDRWWTPKPLRREYFELALADGSSAVVFRCDVSGRWYRQRA